MRSGLRRHLFASILQRTAIQHVAACAPAAFGQQTDAGAEQFSHSQTKKARHFPHVLQLDAALAAQDFTQPGTVMPTRHR
jgi:hypothetical protein